MAQWQEVQSLANTYLEQVHQLYAGSALPMAVRQSLAAWIESQNWRQAAEPLCSHARMLFHSLLVLLGERLGSLGSDREDFMLQHNLRKAHRDLQAEFEEKPERFANLVANLLQEERRILRLGQAGGQGGSAPAPSPAPESGREQQIQRRLAEFHTALQEAERAFRHLEDLQDAFDFCFKVHYQPGEERNRDPGYLQELQSLQAKLQNLDRQRREVLAQMQQLLGRSETLQELLQQELGAWRTRQQRQCLGDSGDTNLRPLETWFTELGQGLFQLRQLLRALGDLRQKVTYARDPLEAETPLLEQRLQEQLTHLLKRTVSGSTGGSRGAQGGLGAALTPRFPQRLRGGAAAQHAQPREAAAGAAHGREVLEPRPAAGEAAGPQPAHGGQDPHRQGPPQHQRVPPLQHPDIEQQNAPGRGQSPGGAGLRLPVPHAEGAEGQQGWQGQRCQRRGSPGCDRGAAPHHLHAGLRLLRVGAGAGGHHAALCHHLQQQPVLQRLGLHPLVQHAQLRAQGPAVLLVPSSGPVAPAGRGAELAVPERGRAGPQPGQPPDAGQETPGLEAVTGQHRGLAQVLKGRRLRFLLLGLAGRDPGAAPGAPQAALEAGTHPGLREPQAGGETAQVQEDGDVPAALQRERPGRGHLHLGGAPRDRVPHFPRRGALHSLGAGVPGPARHHPGLPHEPGGEEPREPPQVPVPQHPPGRGFRALLQPEAGGEPERVPEIPEPAPHPRVLQAAQQASDRGGAAGGHGEPGDAAAAAPRAGDTWGPGDTSGGGHEPRDTAGGGLKPRDTSGHPWELGDTSDGGHEPRDTAGGGLKPRDTSGHPWELGDTSDGGPEPRDTAGGGHKPRDTTGDGHKPRDATGHPWELGDTSDGGHEPRDTSGHSWELGDTSRGGHKPRDTAGHPWEPGDTTGDGHKPRDTAAYRLGDTTATAPKAGATPGDIRGPQRAGDSAGGTRGCGERAGAAWGAADAAGGLGGLGDTAGDGGATAGPRGAGDTASGAEGPGAAARGTGHAGAAAGGTGRAGAAAGGTGCAGAAAGGTGRAGAAAVSGGAGGALGDPGDTGSGRADARCGGDLGGELPAEPWQRRSPGPARSVPAAARGLGPALGALPVHRLPPAPDRRQRLPVTPPLPGTPPQPLPSRGPLPETPPGPFSSRDPSPVPFVPGTPPRSLPSQGPLPGPFRSWDPSPVLSLTGTPPQPLPGPSRGPLPVPSPPGPFRSRDPSPVPSLPGTPPWSLSLLGPLSAPFRSCDPLPSRRPLPTPLSVN